MTAYRDGKPYRAELRARPPQPSTPAARPSTSLPVRHVGGPGVPHKETVGWVNGRYRERTTPNADRRLTNAPPNSAAAALGSLNRARMKPTS